MTVYIALNVQNYTIVYGKYKGGLIRGVANCSLPLWLLGKSRSMPHQENLVPEVLSEACMHVSDVTHKDSECSIRSQVCDKLCIIWKHDQVLCQVSTPDDVIDVDYRDLDD